MTTIYLGGGGSGPIRNYSQTTTTNKTTTTNICVPKEQVFKCTGRGLKPNTRHQFFYENIDRTKDCRQLNTTRTSTSPIIGRLGGPLITDSSGYVEFNFYFTAAVEQEVDRLNKTNYNLVGDKLFELRAVDSSAKKIVPFIGSVYNGSGSGSGSGVTAISRTGNKIENFQITSLFFR
jgi:hypothetical protein